MDQKTPLTVAQAAEHLNHLVAARNGDCLLQIRYDPGFPTMGPQPSVGVTAVYPGFDWDAGSVFLEPAQPLGAAGEHLEKLRKQIEEQGEVLWRIRAAIDNSLLTPEERLTAVNTWLEKVFPKPRPRPARTKNT